MKYLNNIKSPSDLKSYSSEELEFICDELREYIISTINEIGGHLAPTLGTIELTTALHYVIIHLKISLFGIPDIKPTHTKY